MAVVNAPLFSFGARGQLAKSLVFFPWKGLNVVRGYVIPANPDTTDQGIQRDLLAAAVTKLHAAQVAAAHAFAAADKTAYALLASLAATPLTWFNQICKLWIDVDRVATKVPCIYSAGAMTATVHTGAIAIVYLNEKTGSSLAAGSFYLGTTPTTLLVAGAATIVAGVSATNSGAGAWTDLVVGAKYYWQFRPTGADPCLGANSGVYTFVAT